jgi:hypothetical protein
MILEDRKSATSLPFGQPSGGYLFIAAIPEDPPPRPSPHRVVADAG